jgi:hypothetical protein
MEISNKAQGHLSPEFDVDYWFGVAFLETFYIEDVSIYYCNVHTSEE